jgi:predicted DNA-binding antitoxin AbrB/MazE fold protein
MLAIKAVVKDGLIKPLEAIDLPEDKEIDIYISEEKVEEEYPDWTDEETGFAKKVLGNEKEDVWNAI